MAKDLYTSVLDLPRNNWKAALETRRHLKRTKKWTEDDDEVLIMLQNDPTELIDAMERDDSK